MKIDAMIAGMPLRNAQEIALNVSGVGIDGLVVTEGGRTAFLTCTAAGLVADLELATGIAVAFPRSPMVTATVAWELAELTRGRFRLGLGTQVRAHMTRRYGVPFEHPGPRLREYVLALKRIFAAFRGDTELEVQGEFWSMSFLPREWSPGPIDVPDPRIDIAAVNPWMLRMAGEVADGVHVHPLNTLMYLRQHVLPQVMDGVKTAGRHRDDLSISVPCFTAFADSEGEQERLRNVARRKVAYYASTPNYSFIFDELGFEGTTAKVRKRQQLGDLEGMTHIVTDEVLDHFVVTGGWDEAPFLLVDKYYGIADRLVLYGSGEIWKSGSASLEGWAGVVAKVRSLIGLRTRGFAD